MVKKTANSAPVEPSVETPVEPVVEPTGGPKKEKNLVSEEGFGVAASGKEFVSSSQTVADELDQIDLETDEEIGDETKPETSESGGDSDLLDKEIDQMVDEVLDEEKQTDDIDDLLSNRVQKRIDKLTAEKKGTEEENLELKARISALEAKSDVKKEDKTEEVLSDTQIAKAIAQGMEDGDHSVIVDAIKYITRSVKDQTLKEQSELSTAQRAAQQKRNEEWNGLAKEYSPESYKAEQIKNDPNFNLGDKNSQLFRLANRLFESKGYVNVEAGQSRAVREAYSILLENKITGENKKVPKKVDETEGLKNRLGKEQRKTSVLGGSSERGEETPGPLSSDDELADYISDRNKSKNKKLGIEI